VTLFGDRVHVLTGSATDGSEQVERLLTASGRRVESIRPIEPALEDVFVSVLSHAPTTEGQDHEQR
jgi:ABC-2 type transport system ATP-binding protein